MFVGAPCRCRSSPKEAIATALVYFHKFFMLHSFQKHERFVIASACLFLAAKVEVREVRGGDGGRTKWRARGFIERGYKIRTTAMYGAANAFLRRARLPS